MPIVGVTRAKIIRKVQNALSGVTTLASVSSLVLRSTEKPLDDIERTEMEIERSRSHK